MDKRPLGKTGVELSIVGFGGVLVMEETPATAKRLVRLAIERGVNYFDVAPTYGNAEERLGPALEPYRSSVFLACKTEKRTAADATKALHESLAKVRTDWFDLYQLHAVTTTEDVEQITASGGALETLVKARDAGLVRFLGFSAHSEEAALALMERFTFDTVLFPFNWVAWFQKDFGPRVVEKAQEHGMGVLALKSLSKRRVEEGEERSWPKCWYHPVDTAEDAALALRFTLSRPITAAVAPGHEKLFRWACDAADRFQPLSTVEEGELALRSVGLEPPLPH
jgi:aryl-alcohol dehydrogenase-like predicted oxidoreductase